ncbi:DNA mismatch repair protein [Wickerhamomyces ciferrii]|uniref:DNA mismatch repair protein n=1 Tax=Wickerhamomyces ciferrii (strain ATCC 14091 / BCRC 22168 / CBS 111 / JCM 3599 / NBRC 0793 / NRRL Y-1031 F-60-10) TaxID=1206466 RepID=K0KMT6_WICCF|nr:DNA mismatch repair protein [Wickerhamomyces ciferrii]CCH42679.1 DNA mismatch repair protein [Wickerhamomyces ciferrii]
MEQLLKDPMFPEIDQSVLDQLIENQINQVLNPKDHSNIKKKRSRNGCLRCKKLKIKCNEGKPICDYCQHRGAKCQYPKQITSLSKRTISKGSQKPIKNIIINESNESNTSLMVKNTIIMEVDIPPKLNSFEERLYKIFMDFAPSFFTFDINLQAKLFWINEIPKLFPNSKLIQNSIFALSSTRLLYLYKSDFEKAITDSDISTIDLYKKSIEYQNKAITTMESILELTPHNQLSQDQMGQLTISKIILLGTMAIFPHLIDPEKTIKTSNLIKLIEFIIKTSPTTTTTVNLLNNSKYIQLFTMDEEIKDIPTTAANIQQQPKYLFIEYLRSYISTKHPNSFDLEKITYNDCIAMMELGCNRSSFLNYPIPFFKSLVKFSRDKDFHNYLIDEEHTAMKIVFYFSCICSILDIRLLPGLGVWDEFIEIYKNYSFKKFDGMMEDKFDENVYNLVIARGNNEVVYDLNLLKFVGLPMEKFQNGEIELVENEFKCDFRL